MNKASTIPDIYYPNVHRFCSEYKHPKTVLLWLMYCGEDRWLVADWNEEEKYWMIIPGWEAVDPKWLTYWKKL